MNQAPPFDPGIPVLTEVLREPGAAPEAQPAMQSGLPSPLPDTGALGAAEWEQLERRLQESVLQQLNTRVDFVLEQRIRDSMTAVLDQAVHELTMQIRHGLQDTIGKIVARAVQQEIAQLQAPKK